MWPTSRALTDSGEILNFEILNTVQYRWDVPEQKGGDAVGLQAIARHCRAVGEVANWPASLLIDLMQVDSGVRLMNVGHNELDSIHTPIQGSSQPDVAISLLLLLVGCCCV